MPHTNSPNYIKSILEHTTILVFFIFRGCKRKECFLLAPKPVVRCHPDRSPAPIELRLRPNWCGAIWCGVIVSKYLRAYKAPRQSQPSIVNRKSKFSPPSVPRPPSVGWQPQVSPEKSGRAWGWLRPVSSIPYLMPKVYHKAGLKKNLFFSCNMEKI